MSSRTKIVCTIGPASLNLKTLVKMAKAGMSVARLNFSHGTYETHLKAIQLIRRASKVSGIPIAILQDLQGPRIRIGNFKEGKAVLKTGSKFVITAKDILGD